MYSIDSETAELNFNEIRNIDRFFSEQDRDRFYQEKIVLFPYDNDEVSTILRGWSRGQKLVGNIFLSVRDDICAILPQDFMTDKPFELNRKN